MTTDPQSELKGLPSEQEIAEAVDVLTELAQHDTSCILFRWEAGRPTGDGSYESKIDGAWYSVRPINKMPRCQCGLADAIDLFSRCPRLVAVRDGENVYMSRFKPGDRVYSIWVGGGHWRIGWEFPFSGITEHGGVYRPSGEAHHADLCFPTRAEAEEECARRNSQGADQR